MKKLSVNDIKEKTRKITLRWYGHVIRRKNDKKVTILVV